MGILASDLATTSIIIDNGFLGNSVVKTAEKKARDMETGREVKVIINEPAKAGAIPPIFFESGVGGILVKKPKPALRITGIPLLNVTNIICNINVTAIIDTESTNTKNNLSFIFR
ncbi:MAG: hypothetical protein QXV48_04125 [Desulfurococcaceae archaeon]